MNDDPYPLGVRVVLFTIAILLSWAVVFGFMWTVWGLLDLLPTQVIVGGLGLMWCIAIVAYTRWVIGKLRKPKDTKWYVGANGQALVSKPPYDMAQLELEAHEWRLTGKPGSVGAAVVALETIDEVTD